MMPAFRSLGRTGPSPILESVSALRSNLPTVVELKRQQQQHLLHPPPQQSQVSSAGMGPRQQALFSKPVLEPTPAPQPAQSQPSLGESRCSGSSSGSEHEPSSEYLAGLVSDFMDVEEQHESWDPRGAACRPSSLGEDDEEDSPGGLLELASSIQASSSCSSALESRVLSDVLCALQLARSTAALQQDPSSPEPASAPGNGSCAMRRAVMSRLRAAGYNAAVCKSRWDHSRGFPGGDYEFIDVLFESPAGAGFGAPRERLVVDLDFRGQFQVARPTAQFEAALLATPVVFVGRAERLQQLVEMLSDACRRSLRVQGMHLPPWRKAEYLRAKWFAPYKRTTNPVWTSPSASSGATPLPREGAPAKAAESVNAVSGALSPLSFGMWPEAPQLPVAVMRNCQPVQRQRTALRGVLGMLLQEQVGKSSAVL